MARIELGRSKVLRLLAMLGVFVAALTLIAYGLHDEIRALVVWGGETIEEAPLLGGVVFLFLSACSVLLFFLSSVLLVPSAILAWGEWPTVLLLAAGWVSGWTATYAIGRLFRDHAFVEEKLGGEPVEKAAALAGELPFSLVLILIVSLPAEIPGYALGAGRYPFWPFLFAVLLVEIPFAFLVVFIGESFIRENFVVFIGLVVLLLGVAVWQIRSARRLTRPP
jgi:uncharacterized membrane protein YdjX (TVP38/TMEM64 family)